MGFNADGTYVDDFAQGQPGTGSSGTGDNGEKWDPVGKRWIPQGQPGNPAPTAPVGAGGWSDADGGAFDGSAKLGDSYDTRGASTGKVRPMGGQGAWGGYTGTMVDDGHGGVRYDASQNGRQEAVGRAQGLGAAAASQQAYQIDYGAADRFAGMGQGSRGYEQDSLNLAQQTARGENLQSMKLGQSMLQQGVQAQQAGAASTRGGSLAQAAAMRQQAAGQGAFMQQGQTQLDAQRAAEMANGRDMAQQQADRMRAGDATAQGLNQQQGVAQMNQELGQRGLNQEGQMGYEAQGQAINKSAADAALKAKEMAAGIDSAASLRAQQQADRQLQMGANAVSAGGAVLAKAADVFNGKPAPPQGGQAGGSTGEAKPLDPYSNAVSTSDQRAKVKITSLATASLARRGY